MDSKKTQFSVKNQLSKIYEKKTLVHSKNFKKRVVHTFHDFQVLVETTKKSGWPRKYAQKKISTTIFGQSNKPLKSSVIFGAKFL